MKRVNLNKLNFSEMNASGDFKEKIAIFCEDWFSTKPTISVQSSGSTGRSKKMDVFKEKMFNSAKMTCDFLNLKPGYSALLALPVEYISGKMMLVRAFEREMKLLIADPSLYPLRNLTRNVDFCALSPLQVENSLSQLKWIKTLIIGGAAVSESLKRKIYTILDKENSDTIIYETYGMTETLSHVALKQIYPISEDFFTAMDGVKISVDDRGCLIINAPLLNDTILQTNDVVKLIDNKSFVFLGRQDFIINSGGVKINPENLEKFVKMHLENEVVFSAKKDELLGQKLILYIENRNWDVDVQERLKEKIDHLPFEKSFYKPKEIIFLQKIPRTENGKIDRLQLIMK